MKKRVIKTTESIYCKFFMTMLLLFTGSNLFAQTPVADRVHVFPNTQNTIIDVLSNDNLGNCNGASIVIIPTNPLHGTVSVNTDNKLVYIPSTGYYGKDSLSYALQCDAVISAYVAVNIVVEECPDNISTAHCYGTPPANTWGIKQLYRTEEKVVESDVPMVGDVDNDGKIEIVCAEPSGDWKSNALKIFDGATGALKRTIPVADYNPAMGSRAMARIEGTTYIYIAALNGHVYQYDAITGERVRRFRASHFSDCRDATPSILIADFNGSGYPQLIVNDRIFDALTGTLLLNMRLIQANLPYGKGGGHYTDFGFNGCWKGKGTLPVAADMDHDGLPEFVAGNRIYKINIVNRTGTSDNSFSTLRTCTDGAMVGDGFTAVADLDLDGYLDVVVGRNALTTNGYLCCVYAWNGKTGALMGDVITVNNSLAAPEDPHSDYGPSIPFIGDIDGDGYPEIAFSTTYRIHAYKYNLSANSWSSLPGWPVVTTDISASTGLTMFDFDQDGKVELVYRDQDNLRIIDQNGVDKFSTSCRSFTLNEYPIVADVTGDGHANIITAGFPVGDPSQGFYGYLYVFESQIPKAWAPARKVWNQWAYNVVNVNEDLTIPKHMANPATLFPSCEAGKSPSHPYNGFLVQQTVLNEMGCSLWLLPNVQWVNEPDNPTSIYYSTGDSLRIRMKIANIGSAPIGSPIYVTAYRGKIEEGLALTTEAIHQILQQGDTTELFITIKNLNMYLDSDTIHIRLNDNNYLYPAEPSCNSDLEIPVKGVAIPKINNYNLYGTVFPFVHDTIANGNPDTAFNKLFPVTAKLYVVSPATINPLRAILTGTPLYVDTAIYYDGTLFVPKTPKNPGSLGVTNNPGLPLDWSLIGKTQETVDTTYVMEHEIPSKPVGVYTFENVVPGDYILLLSRAGYMMRVAKITVAGNQYLEHRELIPGDVNGRLIIDAYDISLINSHISNLGDTKYDACYDLNADGVIDHKDVILAKFYMSFFFGVYKETMDWLIETEIK